MPHKFVFLISVTKIQGGYQMYEDIDYNQIPAKLNERIRFIRKKHEYTQKEIAESLHIDRGTYAKYESGNRSIPVEAITGLATVYSLSTDFILGISAKPQYVNYKDYQTKLSPRATELLQVMSECDNCLLSGFNTLLESKYAYKIFYFLGLLLKFPNNFDDLLMESEEDVLKYGMLSEYKEDFTGTLNLPRGIFGIEDENLWMMDDVYVPDVFETYFNIYLNKFINEIRESPDTKKAFFDEIKRAYHEDVKETLAEIREYYARPEAREFGDKTE